MLDWVLYGCQEESGMTDMPDFVEKHKGHLPEVFLVCVTVRSRSITAR